jgi:myosin-1
MNDAVATAHADSEGADRSFAMRLESCSSNPHFGGRGDSSFVIKHYAGKFVGPINVFLV